ncbi:TetR/AcrR family transcriptional regulator [Acetonema longum]|uniref:TetR family transcriptional regulator n=1 Tax=Acetonema longum DSM 6540 TaxID=1009370 RepID=F7NP12_9FIRM|nr:TetR family transcriptional regulator [Acetonema longum]EGO62135.1 TetR family transcriptional regulator [Acetonema longum DSM 6540]
MDKDPRDKLIEVGTRLFAKKGLAAVTIRELADAAGTNSAMISYYFGGKEGLYAAVMEAHLEKIRSVIKQAQLNNLEPLEKIRRYGQGVLNIHNQSPYLIRLVFSEITNPTVHFEPVRKTIGLVALFLQQAIREGIEAGQIRPDVDPAYATVALAGILNFFFIARPLAEGFLPQGQNHEGVFNRQALDIFLNGIALHDDVADNNS